MVITIFIAARIAAILLPGPKGELISKSELSNNMKILAIPKSKPKPKFSENSNSKKSIILLSLYRPKAIKKNYKYDIYNINVKKK